MQLCTPRLVSPAGLFSWWLILDWPHDLQADDCRLKSHSSRRRTPPPLTIDTNPLPVPPTCLLPRGPQALLPLNWCHRPSKVQGNWADQPPPQHHNTPGPPMAAATCHSGHHNTPGPSMAAATCHSVHHSPSPPQCRPTMATSLACCIPYWSHCHSHHSEVPILLQSHTPHRLQIQVGALEKFVFAIHPCFRVKVVNPDSLFCLPSLRFGEYVNQLHLEV